jgi:hypothetical protein
VEVQIVTTAPATPPMNASHATSSTRSVTISRGLTSPIGLRQS